MVISLAENILFKLKKMRLLKFGSLLRIIVTYLCGKCNTVSDNSDCFTKKYLQELVKVCVDSVFP